MLRRRRREPARPALDAGLLPPRYQPPVRAAISAGQRFDELVGSLAGGPIRERLEAMAPRIRAGVQAVWETANRAAQLERHVATLDPGRVTADLKAARRSGADEAELAALTARFESVQRLLNGHEEITRRLPVAEARLDAAVARAAEIAYLSWVGEGDLQALDDQLASALVELDAIGSAVGELSR